MQKEKIMMKQPNYPKSKSKKIDAEKPESNPDYFVVDSFDCFKSAIIQQVIEEVIEKTDQEGKVEQKELDCTDSTKDTEKNIFEGTFKFLEVENSALSSKTISEEIFEIFVHNNK